MRNLFLLLLLYMGLIDEMSEKPQQWYVVTDRVMGGSSNLEADFNEGIYRMTGNVVKKDGGFVRLVHNPQDVDQEVKGIRFMAKGNNETYEVHVTMQGLRMPPWAYHSSTFDVDAEWKIYEVNFSNFEKKSGVSPKLRPSNIRDISFAGYGRDFDVDLQIKNISFY